MTSRRLGRWTVHFPGSPRIVSAASVVGPKEGEGPLRSYFDVIESDPMRGEACPEAAERRFMEEACNRAIRLLNLKNDDIDIFLGGDLLNQVITAGFTARSLQIPFLGLYSACATVGAALMLAGTLVDCDWVTTALVAASSHYQTAERQFRYPIELNIQRKPTNQWTVTGAGAAVIAKQGEGPKLTHATIGRVVDYGLKDTNDMGCTMAPAAADTLLRHLADTGRTPGDYDLILTGDLAAYGAKMFRHLVKEASIGLGNKHQDAGQLIFSSQQKVGAGGSGCACVAVVGLGYVLKEMAAGRWHRVLLLPTGALFSPVTHMQGESIPCVAHAIVIES
ncbi:MAG: stage V sporulation protein AD [Limnochordia bacterium]